MSNLTMREKVLHSYLKDLEESLDYYASEMRFGSPIEQAFFEAFYTIQRGNIYVADVDGPQGDEPWTIHAQTTVGPYRVDFVICANYDGLGRMVVVECDGHEFHERTKEQAERDRKRDRYLQKEGYEVLRFTGAEIYRDPIACAHEVRAHFWSSKRKESGRA